MLMLAMSAQVNSEYLKSLAPVNSGIPSFFYKASNSAAYSSVTAD